MMNILLLIATLATVACSRPTPPVPATEQAASISTASCGQDCTSSITCHDIISSCRYCGLDGRCSATLPADPKPDAGIDAAPGGTSP